MPLTKKSQEKKSFSPTSHSNRDFTVVLSASFSYQKSVQWMQKNMHVHEWRNQLGAISTIHTCAFCFVVFRYTCYCSCCMFHCRVLRHGLCFVSFCIVQSVLALSNGLDETLCGSMILTKRERLGWDWYLCMG